jgi:hypothetical protein
VSERLKLLNPGMSVNCEFVADAAFVGFLVSMLVSWFRPLSQVRGYQVEFLATAEIAAGLG